MDEKPCKKRLDRDSKPLSPCVRVGVWVFSCAAISLLALILAFTLWTLVSYHNTVLTLQDRVDTLERVVEMNSQNMEQIIESKIETILQKVSYFSEIKEILELIIQIERKLTHLIKLQGEIMYLHFCVHN